MLKQKQEAHDALCLPYLREATGPTRGSRTTRSGWHPVAVWQDDVEPPSGLAYRKAPRYFVPMTYEGLNFRYDRFKGQNHVGLVGQLGFHTGWLDSCSDTCSAKYILAKGTAANPE